MPNANMPPVVGGVKLPVVFAPPPATVPLPLPHGRALDAVIAARAEFVQCWTGYLASDPPQAEATEQLMAIQAVIRQAHDLMTGRVRLGDCAE